jgi:nickel transport protein
MGNCAVGRAAAIVPLLVMALMMGEALGHDIRMSARVEGRRIVGKVYVRGGGAVAGATVTALDPDRRELASTQTDREGLFSLPIRMRCDHRLLADVGDGHGAEYVIKASLLPEDLPAADDAPGAAAPQTRQPPAAEDASAGTPADTQTQPAAKAAEGAEAVKQLRAEIDELRQQLDQYRQRVRLLDVLGGVGYILGLTGIAYYWLSLRRNR